MRYIYQSEVQDGRGNFVAGASVTVTRAGGTTKASIYSALTGGTVDADGIITTGTDGTFAFYVDEDDYSHSQQFRIVWSKSGFTSETWDYIQIFPDGDRTLLTSSTVDQGDAAIVGTLAWHVADASTDPVTVKILPGTYLVSTLITVASTMTLDIPQKIALTDDASNATLTINGHLGAGIYQIFDWGTGSGAVVLGSGSTEVINPIWFGAAGDGSTDDTTKISSMLSSSTAASVTFDGLNKAYELTATISKSLSSSVRWKLQNFKFETDTIANPGSETGAINITGDESITASVWSGTNKIEIDNVVFTDNETATQANLDGIMILNFDEVSLKNVKASGYSNTGIFIEVSRLVSVVNCEASSNLYAGLRGSNIYSGVVTGGEYNSNGKTIPTDGYGVAFSAGDQVNSNINLLVQGVTANDNKRKGIDFHAGIHAKVIGNHIAGFGLIGIYALADTDGNITRDIIIIGNTVEGDANLNAGGAGIAIGANGAVASTAGQWIVSNNIIKDTDTAGSQAIEIDANSTGYGAENVIIEGNIITDGASSTSSIIDVHGSNLIIGSVKIANNIIHSAAAAYGIEVANATTATIQGNQLTVDGGTVTMGIHAVETATRRVMIDDNYIMGAATYTGTINQATTAASWTSRNNRYIDTILKEVIGPSGISIDFGNDVPSSGDYVRGSVRYNTAATTGQPGGWSCTVSGSPGTWKAWANLP